MSPDLQYRIKRVYPDGTIDSLDEDALKDDERDHRVRATIESVTKACNLVYEVQPFNKPAYSICLTQADHPAFGTWIWSMDNAAKIRWITDHGNSYPVLWLEISRVAPFYYLHYNHWKPRGDTGYLDADFRDEPNEQWKGYQGILEGTLQRNGFALFDAPLAAEKTSLVQERDYYSIPDEDPRWADTDFEPPLIDSSLHECLFSH